MQQRFTIKLGLFARMVNKRRTVTDMQTKQAEEILHGGFSTPGVVRVGDTVRRPILRDPTFRHAVMRHLERVGFRAAPRILGTDERGREILGFIQGIAASYLKHFDDGQLRAVAALLRRFHDAAAGSVLCAGEEVVCHNDWGPGNAIFENGLPAAMIDFDTAAPGTRLWDLGRAAWNWLNLGDTAYSATEQLRRLAVFASGYAWPTATPRQIALHAVTRQISHAAWARRAGKADVEAWARHSADWTASYVVETLICSGRETA